MDWFHPTLCAVDWGLSEVSRTIDDVRLSPPSTVQDIWTVERLSSSYSVSLSTYEEAAAWANRLLNRDRCGPAVRRVLGRPSAAREQTT